MTPDEIMAAELTGYVDAKRDRAGRWRFQGACWCGLLTPFSVDLGRVLRLLCEHTPHVTDTEAARGAVRSRGWAGVQTAGQYRLPGTDSR